MTDPFDAADPAVTAIPGGWLARCPCGGHEELFAGNAEETAWRQLREHVLATHPAWAARVGW
jgi:hypothetical protein